MTSASSADTILLNLASVLILLCAFACLGSKLFDRYLTYYAVQSVLLSAAAAIVAEDLGSPALWVLSVLTLLIKGVGIPVTTRRYLVARLSLKRDAAITLGLSTSLIIGAGLTALAYFAMRPSTLPGRLLDTAAVPLAMAVVLLGGLCMVVRRHTIAQLLGWLIVENGVFLGAITLVATFPFIVEAGIFLDLVAGVLIMLALVSGLAQRLASASASDLRRLRG
jgi:hydrogenase-4 component E